MKLQGGGFNCETVKLSVLVRNSADWKNKIWSKVIYLKKYSEILKNSL